MSQRHLKIARHRILVTGKVHGVGFRYHVLKLAERYRLNGFVANCPEGVQIEIEGAGDTLDFFVSSLRSRPPPYSEIVSIRVSPASLRGEKGFRVLPDAELSSAMH